jgi:STE24 endopeptidase
MIAINTFLLIFLFVLILGTCFELWLEWINARHLKRSAKQVPAALQTMVDATHLQKMVDYNLDHTKVALVYGTVDKIVLLFIILSGWLPWLVGHVEKINFILAGLIFFAFIGLVEGLIHLPFDYYQIFVIEERYGFNTRTFKTWISDLLKNLMIGMIIGVFLLCLLFILIQNGAKLWWIWGWLIFFGFQFIMTILYPKIIAPLFNKFIPIENQALAEKINELATREGLKVEGIFQMDAGKRSRHTNAYFTGLGKTKRIVLFDTLLHSHTDDEILAVLAHEIGHLKKGHIRKQLIGIGLLSFALFFLVSCMLNWELMYQSFGFNHTPAYVGLFLISILGGPFGLLISPVFMMILRRYEKGADQYAYTLIKTAAPLTMALKKMTLDNLSNINPHALYVLFHYSHPPILERIAYMEAWERNTENGD